ncbi:hypothetical protein VLK31_09065 [Variovorax sp. H27-G14]|uniref:hypothetical protein n=1 Tax=Variovorax sp. H27-G14 TaxID=3111914 RepID=UPI0038FCEB53
MNKYCDIFLPDQIKGALLLLSMSPDIKKLRINKDAEYSGFLGLRLPRLQGVALVVELRRSGVSSFNVPVEYRDGKLLTEEEILKKAQSYISQESSIWVLERAKATFHPMVIDLMTDDEKYHLGGEGGGVLVIDRLNGHAWTENEMVNYLYGYNNIL